MLRSVFQFSQSRIVWLAVALGAYFFIPFLGSVHLFDWDEINFAESAREMIVTGDYFRVRVDFQPFWEKPPFFFWLQALSMKLFGVNEFGARFPNGFFGIITLITIFFIGKREKDQRFGVIWMLLYLGSFLPHLYFKSAIIDPVFNYFIFVAVYFLYQALQGGSKQDGRKYALLSGFSIGLAMLTKGPVGLLLLLLTFFSFWGLIKRFRRTGSIQQILLLALAAFVASFLWYGPETIQNGPWFLVEFIQYQIELFSQPVAGHEQPLYYHFVVVLIGCFPLSVIALPAFFKQYQDTSGFIIWCKLLFWVVMILFTIVTTKIVHYSSMAYLPLSFLAANTVYQAMEKGNHPPKWLGWVLAFIGGVFALLLTAFPILGINKEVLMDRIADPNAVGALQVNVPWGGWEWIIGLIFLALVIYGSVLWKRNQAYRSITVLCLATAFTMQAFTAVVVPKIEAHSQGEAIAFYEELRGRDVYVRTLGFKSYAPFFYFRQSPNQSEKRRDKNWLLTGPIDKPAYFVTKVSKVKNYEKYTELQELYRSGGFVFYKRDVPQ